MIGTNKRAGAMHIIDNCALGFPSIVTIGFAKINNNPAKITLITPISANDILNTLCAPNSFPSADLSATIFEIAAGAPFVENTSKKMYIGYADC